MLSLQRLTPHLLCLTASSIAACAEGASDAGSGALSVLLESEDAITRGIEAGDSADAIHDGWSVSFEKYLAVLGHIEAHLATNQDKVAHDDTVLAVDLKKLPSAGSPLWELTGLARGRWEMFFAQTGADHGAERHDSVEPADFDELVEKNYTYLIHGSLKNPEGSSCPPATLADPGDKTPNSRKSGSDSCYDASEVRFELGVEAETLYGPCESDGIPGFSIASNRQTVSVTIHGDHLFFNGFPEGGEGGVTRLAQWLADCDLDLNGTVTRAELEQIAPSDLRELDDRFQLGGSPISPLDNMYDYVRSQLKTQGHMNGEGECPIDGEAHEH